MKQFKINYGNQECFIALADFMYVDKTGRTKLFIINSNGNEHMVGNIPPEYMVNELQVWDLKDTPTNNTKL